jgi:hypothetical protein
MTSKTEYAVIAFERAAKSAHTLVDRVVWDHHRLHCRQIDGLRENLELSVKRLYARLDEMIGKGYTEQVADIEQPASWRASCFTITTGCASLATDPHASASGRVGQGIGRPRQAQTYGSSLQTYIQPSRHLSAKVGEKRLSARGPVQLAFQSHVGLIYCAH